MRRTLVAVALILLASTALGGQLVEVTDEGRQCSTEAAPNGCIYCGTSWGKWDGKTYLCPTKGACECPKKYPDMSFECRGPNNLGWRFCVTSMKISEHTCPVSRLVELAEWAISQIDEPNPIDSFEPSTVNLGYFPDLRTLAQKLRDEAKHIEEQSAKRAELLRVIEQCKEVTR